MSRRNYPLYFRDKHDPDQVWENAGKVAQALGRVGVAAEKKDQGVVSELIAGIGNGELVVVEVCLQEVLNLERWLEKTNNTFPILWRLVEAGKLAASFANLPPTDCVSVPDSILETIEKAPLSPAERS